MIEQDVAAFLADRFAGLAPGERIEIRSFTLDRKHVRQTWHATPAEAAHVALARPRGHGVYYGVNPRTPGGGKKEDVTRIFALWADLDFKHFPDGAMGAAAALERFPLQPTVVVHSGNGWHPYWQLAEPTEPSEAIEALLARLYVALGGLDGVQDASRVFRLPGTLNHKLSPPSPVTIRDQDFERRYTIGQFEAILPPPPPSPARRPPRGPTSRATLHDQPDAADIREWLRHIPPTGDYKDHWIKVLAAVASVLPGPDGVALCEEWSHSQPGEVAKKFASFTRPAGTRGSAGVGTLHYMAKEGGWQPSRPAAFTMPSGAVDDHAAAVLRLTAERAEAIARAEKAERLVAYNQTEHARKDAEIADLQRAVRALEACVAHTDQTVGGAAMDLSETIVAAYRRGDVLVVDGKEYAKVFNSQAAKRRSASTVGRAGVKVAAAGIVPTLTRREQIETPTFKGEAEIRYYHVPEELRTDPYRVALHLLPPVAPKAHGGVRRRVELPAVVRKADVPVRRVLERSRQWRSLANDSLLHTEKLSSTAAYFDQQGVQMTAKEALAFQHRVGADPRQHVPFYQPVQLPLSEADRDLVRRVPLDDGINQPPVPVPDPACLVNGCGQNPGPDRYCKRHAALRDMIPQET